MSESPKESFLDRLHAWLERVGKSRDGILIVGGALYILGYIVWSVNAYREKLGLLPAFESQYFIAGIVPFGVMFLLWQLIRATWSDEKPLLARWGIGSTLTWWGNFFKLLPSIFVVASVVLSQTGLTKYLAGRGTLVLGVLAGVAGLLVIVAVFSIDFGEDLKKLKPGSRETNWTQKIFLGLQFLIILAAGGFVLFIYIPFFYSKLPQSLGGVRPRCAYLDVQKNGVSKTTLNAILPLDAAPPATPMSSAAGVTIAAEPEITRSAKVEVLFSGSDYILIRVNKEVYEIKKDVIHAAQSCD